MAKGKEVAVKGDNFFQKLGEEMPELTPEQRNELQKFESEGMSEELRGLPISYPRIEILHQGTAKFRFVDEDEIVNAFDGVIVHIEQQRAFWKEKYGQQSGDSKPPDCFSRDLVRPDPMSENRQSEACSGCPMNEWGSAVKEDGTTGRGKGCKEIRRLFVVPAGRLTPHWIMIPPSNLKPLAKYLQSIRGQGIKRPQLVVTKFSLSSVKNKDSVKYSELALAKGDAINDSTVYSILELKRKIEEMLSSAAPVSSNEYDAGHDG